MSWELPRDTSGDDLYLHLHGAREHLCLAQMHAPDPDDRQELERAVQRIDSVGSRCCRQWSRFDRTHEDY